MPLREFRKNLTTLIHKFKIKESPIEQTTVEVVDFVTKVKKDAGERHAYQQS